MRTLYRVGKKNVHKRFFGKRFYSFTQTTLPRLPLPEVKETVDFYLSRVAPLLTPEQFAITEINANNFLKAAKPLQSYLQDIDRRTPKSSWMAGFWNSMYLQLRDPLPINVSPIFVFKKDPDEVKNNHQAALASSLLYGAGIFAKNIQTNNLSPDLEKNTPLDMTQYKQLFVTRIPQTTRDTITNTTHARHVTVICQDNYYQIQLLDSRGRVREPSRLYADISNIISDAGSKRFREESLYPVGILTARNRDDWAISRKILLSEGNTSSLRDLESSLLVLNLDLSVPHSLEDFSKMLLHSDGSNRWFDKSIQLVVSPNGYSGIVMEHSSFDGHTMLRFMNEVYKESSELTIQSIIGTHVASLHELRKIEFSLSPALRKVIFSAKEEYFSFVRLVDTSVFINDYGKNAIAALKMSPDAFVQMAFQLAYYRLYKQFVSVYESSSMKHFLHGRTETVRSVTLESKEFVLKFYDPEVSKEEKLASFRKALEKHVSLVNDTKLGKGDRHLQGLLWTAKLQVQSISGYEIPKFFTDPAYSLFTQNILSTSNCSSESIQIFGFGPVIGEGFGLGYSILANTIPINITSFDQKAPLFKKSLKQTFIELKETFGLKISSDIRK